MAAQPLADWYPDPKDTLKERWWDGNKWTENIRDLKSDTPPMFTTTTSPVKPTTSTQSSGFMDSFLKLPKWIKILAAIPIGFLVLTPIAAISADLATGLFLVLLLAVVIMLVKPLVVTERTQNMGIDESPSAAATSNNGVGRVKKGKQVKETKCTCKSCGKIWHYGKQEQFENANAAMSNAGKSMMCCGGCAPAILIPDKKVVKLDRCPNCGSKAITTERVVHYV